MILINNRQKTKCDGNNPCQKCAKMKRECTYSERKPKIYSTPISNHSTFLLALFSFILFTFLLYLISIIIEIT